MENTNTYAEIMPFEVLTVEPLLPHLIGDPRVQEAKLIWVQPELTRWVKNSSAEQKGELALEIAVEKIAAAESGGTWGVVMDACVPVMDLIDTTRSAPCNIQEVQKVFGIFCVFDRVVQVRSCLLPF
jgi:DNA-directed RNA polymerase-5 subunit 1